MDVGTDTFPQDIVSLLWWGASAGKFVEQCADTATTREFFDAATLGGARALDRPDIGRLAPGAKATWSLQTCRECTSVRRTTR